MKSIEAFSRWFSSSRRQAKRRRRSGARQAAERRSLFLEPLHPRILLSADDSVDGTVLLSVRGDENANTLVIEQTAQSPTGVTIRLTLDESSPVTVSDVKEIVVDAGGQ